MAAVEFFYYYGCPWTYFASGRLQEAAMRTGAQIVWRPILVDRVKRRLAPAGAGGHAETNPARARYQAKDLADWARFCGVSIRRPGPFPVKAEWAMRGACVAIRGGLAVSYSERIFSSCFDAVEDIDDTEVVVAAAQKAGMDAAAFRREVMDPASLRLVEDNSDELLARGGFGSPTMFIGNDMYFGNDRMPLVEWALSEAAERPLVVPGDHGKL